MDPGHRHHDLSVFSYIIEQSYNSICYTTGEVSFLELSLSCLDNKSEVTTGNCSMNPRTQKTTYFLCQRYTRKLSSSDRSQAYSGFVGELPYWLLNVDDNFNTKELNRK
jgi:hypothetical protein